MNVDCPHDQRLSCVDDFFDHYCLCVGCLYDQRLSCVDDFFGHYRLCVGCLHDQRLHLYWLFTSVKTRDCTVCVIRDCLCVDRTASLGYGTAPIDTISLLVIVIIAAGLGIPFIIMIIGGIYVGVKKRRKSGYQEIGNGVSNNCPVVNWWPGMVEIFTTAAALRFSSYPGHEPWTGIVVSSRWGTLKFAVASGFIDQQGW